MSGFFATSKIKVLAASAVAVSHTGDTNETALATVSIPAGAMGSNGVIRVRASLTMPSSANAKTVRTRLGGLAGTAFGSLAYTTVANVQHDTTIANRNSAASQFGSTFGNRATDLVYNLITATTGTINTAVDQNLVVSIQLASAAETVALESYLVELIVR